MSKFLCTHIFLQICNFPELHLRKKRKKNSSCFLEFHKNANFLFVCHCSQGCVSWPANAIPLPVKTGARSQPIKMLTRTSFTSRNSFAKTTNGCLLRTFKTKSKNKRLLGRKQKHSPFMLSHFVLPTLKQEVFMFAGRTFHHLYS